MLSFIKNKIFKYTFLILTIFLIWGISFSGYKSSGNVEITADVANGYGSSFMTSSSYEMFSLMGQSGSTGIFSDPDTLLLAGFLNLLGDPPVLNINSVVNRKDGTGKIDISVDCNDPDQDLCKLKIEWEESGVYHVAAISGPVTASVGSAPSLDPGSYQIGVTTPILTTSTNTITFVWDSMADLATRVSTFTLRISLNDGSLDTQVTTTTYLDNAKPVIYPISDKSNVGKDFVGVKFSTTPTYEINFSSYKIFYSSVTSNIDETMSVWTSTNDSNLGYMNYGGALDTIIRGLEDNTSYYFSLWCYDTFGNISSATAAGPYMTISSPSVSIEQVITSIDGSGLVIASCSITAPDSDSCSVKIEYSTNNGTNWYQAYIASVSAPTGAPLINNTSSYQLSEIVTDSFTPKGFQFIWSSTDEANGGGAVIESTSVVLRLTPYSSISGMGGSPISTIFTVDNKAPVQNSPKAFIADNITASQARISWTSFIEPRFSHFEIWYATFTPVTRNDGYSVMWSTANDAALNTTATTASTITGLTEATQYYAKMWAIDTYGNVSTTTTTGFSTQHRPVATFVTMPVQSANGDSYVSMNVDLYDVDLDTGLKLRVEFSSVSLSGPWVKAYVDLFPADPSVSLDNVFGNYQITGANVSGGTKTLSGLTWISNTSGNMPLEQSSTVYIRLIANDGTNDSVPLTTSTVFDVDNIKPVCNWSQYDYATKELVVSFDENINTSAINISSGVYLSTSVSGGTILTVAGPVTSSGTNGFSAILTDDQSHTIGSWQRAGYALKISLGAGVVKDYKGNMNDVLVATNVTNWIKDLTIPQVLSAAYDVLTEYNKFSITFNKAMAVDSIQNKLTGITLQDAQSSPAHSLTLTSADQVITTADSSVIDIRLSDAHVRTIGQWPFSGIKELYLVLDTTATPVCDSVGNISNAIDSSNGLKVDPYRPDTVRPEVKFLVPKGNEVYLDPRGKDVVVQFTERISLDNISSKYYVVEVRNNLGVSIFNVVSGTITFDTATNKLIFTPVSTFSFNYKCIIYVKGTIEDMSGNVLYPGDQEKFFYTIFNASEDNMFIARNPELDDNTVVNIPAGFFTTNGQLVFNVVGDDITDTFNTIDVEEAIRKKIKEDNFNQTLRNTLTQLSPADVTGAALVSYMDPSRQENIAQLQISPNSTYKITMPYKDADNNGVVDTIFPPVRVDSLRLYYLDAPHKLWVRVPEGKIDKASHSLTTNLAFFGVFALLGAPDTDLSQAYAYPVPFKPSEGHKVITFTNLASECTIKIFTISGELVKTIVHNDGLYTHEWDVKNEDGKNVASGVYIYSIKSAADKKQGKIMIIR
jgi:hypothetical protein